MGQGMNSEGYEYLNAVRNIDLKILRLGAKKKMLESCLYPSGIRYDLDKVQGSRENQMERLMGEISEIDKKIDALNAEKIKKAADIENTIDKLDNDETKTVLSFRFITDMRVNDIAEVRGYSPDWVYKRIREGVDEVGKMLKT
jgi:uncharacterized protein YlxW (UPF0749 family)